MIKLLPEERQLVAQYIHSICAITLDQSKDYLIESRLSAVMARDWVDQLHATGEPRQGRRRGEAQNYRRDHHQRNAVLPRFGALRFVAL